MERWPTPSLLDDNQGDLERPIAAIVPFRSILEPMQPPVAMPDEFAQPPIEEVEPDRYFEYFELPVRMPEVNQIAIQQLTLADEQRNRTAILSGVNRDIQSLLNALKNEGKIEDFNMLSANEAEVTLNGGLHQMSDFARRQSVDRPRLESVLRRAGVNRNNQNQQEERKDR